METQTRRDYHVNYREVANILRLYLLKSEELNRKHSDHMVDNNQVGICTISKCITEENKIALMCCFKSGILQDTTSVNFQMLCSCG